MPKLQKLLGSAYSVQNYGVSGTTLLKRGNSPYWNTGRIAQVLAFKPDIVTIKLGTNDTKPYNWDVHGSEFKQDYGALIDTLNTLDVKPRVFLVLPVPVFTVAASADWGIRDSVIQIIIPIIKEIANERNLPVVDANTPLISFPQYFTVDGVHPDSRGADTIASVIYRGIKDAPTGMSRIAAVSKENSFHSNVYPIVNGDPGALFAMVKPGCRYELSVFNPSGIMISKVNIDSSPVSRMLVQSIFANTRMMRIAVVKKIY